MFGYSYYEEDRLDRSCIELLAPAGDLISLKAAINAGADAVYVGGSRFGARAYAENFGIDAFKEGIEYAHLHGRRIYLTVNTLLKEAEMEELCEYLYPYYREGLDAVIVQDLGAFSKIHEWYPNLNLHASTQMTVTGWREALRLKEAGATRVVTARELSLDEIRQIKEHTGMEIESFVHGALCYCYSGQCLLSSILGGRSGNRGRCAQPCRLPYDVMDQEAPLNHKNEKYVLSPKDMCTLEILPKLFEAGVHSLKIEGRMKKPEYTAGVVSIYRKYLDRYFEQEGDHYHVDPKDLQDLSDLFNRNGFHKSYYEQHNGRNMITLSKTDFRIQNEALVKKIDQNYVHGQIQEEITGQAVIRADQPMRLMVSAIRDGKTYCAEAEVDAPQPAMKQPATKKAIQERLQKTGNTPFRFASIDIQLDDDLFVPVAQLNELRREALEALREQILEAERRYQSKPVWDTLSDTQSDKKQAEEQDQTPAFSAAIQGEKQLKAVMELPDIRDIYIEAQTAMEWSPDKCRLFLQQAEAEGKHLFIRMPHIYREEHGDLLETWTETFIQNGFAGFVVRNMETYDLLADIQKQKERELEIILDYSIYAWNRAAMQMLENLPYRPQRLTLPLELNQKEMRMLSTKGKEILVYGKIPLMVTAGCLKKTLKSCRRQSSWISLKDRKGICFPVFTFCKFCYNVIYNEKPVSLSDCSKEVLQMHPAVLRLEFTDETPEQIRQISKLYCSAFLKNEKNLQLKQFTRGHFKRGVE